MKKLLLALVLSLLPTMSLAVNPMCPTRSSGDSTNACASTAFVTTGIAADFASPPPLGNLVPNQVFATTLSSTLASSIAGVPFNPAVVVPSSFSAPNQPGIPLAPGTSLYIAGTPNSTATDVKTGVLYVTKNASYSGIPTGELSAIYGFNNINAGVQGVQAGILGYVANNNTLTSQPGGTSGAVGVHGVGACSISGCAATWGGVFSGYGFGAANPTNALYGAEIDNYDNGTDSHGLRIGLQVVGGRPIPGVGAPNTVTNLVFLGGAATEATYGNLINLFVGTTAVNGLNLNGGTFSGNAILSPGLRVDPSGNIFPNTLALTNAPVIWLTDTGSSGGQILIDTASTNMFLDDLAGGSLVFRTTGLTEVARITAGGILNITGASGFAANGSVATVLGSLGPTSSHTTVQRWLVVQDAGVTGWVPVF